MRGWWVILWWTLRNVDQLNQVQLDWMGCSCAAKLQRHRYWKVGGLFDKSFLKSVTDVIPVLVLNECWSFYPCFWVYSSPTFVWLFHQMNICIYWQVMRSGIPNFCAVALALGDLGYVGKLWCYYYQLIRGLYTWPWNFVVVFIFQLIISLQEYSVAFFFFFLSKWIKSDKLS